MRESCRGDSIQTRSTRTTTAERADRDWNLRKPDQTPGQQARAFPAAPPMRHMRQRPAARTTWSGEYLSVMAVTIEQSIIIEVRSATPSEYRLTDDRASWL